MIFHYFPLTTGTWNQEKRRVQDVLFDRCHFVPTRTRCMSFVHGIAAGFAAAAAAAAASPVAAGGDSLVPRT